MLGWHHTLITLLASLRGPDEAAGEDAPRSHLFPALGPDGLQGHPGVEGGGNTFTEHPASSGVSLSPYKPGSAIVIIRTRNTRPRGVESLVKVTQPGSGGVGFEPRAS